MFVSIPLLCHTIYILVGNIMRLTPICYAMWRLAILEMRKSEFHYWLKSSTIYVTLLECNYLICKKIIACVFWESQAMTTERELWISYVCIYILYSYVLDFKILIVVLWSYIDMDSHALCRCAYICAYIGGPICVYCMLRPVFKVQILAMCWALLELRTLFNASLNFIHRC